MNEQATQYAARGRKFLAQASEELARNDLPQASEKGWGAAAQLVKAAAEQRGWPHGQHRQLYEIVRNLAAEEGSDELRKLFGLAGELHTNFYEEIMSTEVVEYHLSEVTGLVERVEAILRNGTAA